MGGTVGSSESKKESSFPLAVISAGGALLAAALSGYVTYYTSVLNATISEKQAETQQRIVELQESTKRQISDLESSFKRAELFTRSIKELKNAETSALVLMGLWPLFSKPEERRVIIAAALHVGNPEIIDVLGKLGTELDPFLDNVIQEAMKSKKPGVAKAVTDFVRARKAAILEGLLRPVALQLERTETAFHRYSSNTREPYETIIREGNAKIRNLLNEKAKLIPADLKADADKLIEHYNKWFEEFERLRGGKTPNESLVSAGPAGYPFPVSSAHRFEERFCSFNTELDKETDDDLAAIQIRQVPTALPKREDSNKDWYKLAFSVFVERASHKCMLNKIYRVVYVMDEKWWKPQNEFPKADRTNNFELVTRVWGTTKVKARILIRGRNRPVLREGMMKLGEVTFFKGPTRTRAVPSQN